MKRTGVTIRDVARVAQVSVSTASRHLAQRGYVSLEARGRIDAAVSHLGYRPNAVARSLRHQRTHTVALVVPEIENPFYTTISRGIEDVANAAGYAVIFCNTDEQEEKQDRYLHAVLERKIDGLLFVPCGASVMQCRMLDAAGLPYVFIDRALTGNADAVLGDNADGARRLTQHLLDLGHQRIGLVGGNTQDSVSRERRAGYEDALTAAGLVVDASLVREADWSIESSWYLTRALLALERPPTALFCTNNLLAVGSLQALREADRRVPHDVALVCFDDIELASLIDPFLTVAVQPAYEMGSRAATLLLDRLAGQRDTSPVREILPVQLIIRRSCGATGPIGRSNVNRDSWIGRRWRPDDGTGLSMPSATGPESLPTRTTGGLSVAVDREATA